LHFIADLNNTIASSTFTYLTQHTPLGLGHAVLQAQPYVQNDNFFCVMLPDNIIENDETILAHLVTLAQQYNASIICVENINPADAHAYGVIQPKTFLTDNLIEIEAIIEKPRFDQGIFTLAQVGRYVFSSDIFDALTVIKPGINGEIQLTDAIAHMMASGKRVLAYLLPGKRHDIGTIRGLLKTTVTLALHNPLYKNMMIEIFNNEINICS
jgi:UTP--glucose-1-phosphate uridylyltransferase